MRISTPVVLALLLFDFVTASSRFSFGVEGIGREITGNPTVRITPLGRFGLDVGANLLTAINQEEQGQTRLGAQLGILPYLWTLDEIRLGPRLEGAFAMGEENAADTPKQTSWALDAGGGIDCEYFLVPRLSLGWHVVFLYRYSEFKVSGAAVDRMSGFRLAGQLLTVRFSAF